MADSIKTSSSHDIILYIQDELIQHRNELVGLLEKKKLLKRLERKMFSITNEDINKGVELPIHDIYEYEGEHKHLDRIGKLVDLYLYSGEEFPTNYNKLIIRKIDNDKTIIYKPGGKYFFPYPPIMLQ